MASTMLHSAPGSSPAAKRAWLMAAAPASTSAGM
jgi:hypothetical protein